MAEIDLSGDPYYDDSEERKSEHYRVLFRPGRSVQVRELNELQATLQRQIERFGDSIYRTGTIIDGCNFSFFDVYPYAKLSDSDTSGVAIDVSAYEGLIARNQDGLKARVLTTVEGLETDNPDLNTIYVKYRNAGPNKNTQSFSAGDILTFSDKDEKIHSVQIDAAGVSFINSDPIVFSAAIVVNVTSGSFTNGEFITQPSLGSNLQIINIDTTLKASNGHVVLSLKPRDVDLANADANASIWSTVANASVRNSGNTAVGTVIEILGTGASAEIVTDASGRVSETVVVDEGEGYEVAPTARIRSANNTTGLSSLSLTAKNYLAQVAVANVGNATGNGYAFGVTDGIIYQKGYFIDVEHQIIVVEKYNQSPSNVAVGFDTIATFVTSDEDNRLLDQVTGEGNELAPGADRLKLTPTLVVLDSANASTNNDFLTLVEWSEGNPFLQRREPVYSRIGDEFAKRTAETSGDFVINEFQVTTRSTSNSSLEGSHHSVVIDPGTAYVLGARIETVGNYIIDVEKSTTVRDIAASVGLTYGPYVRVKEVGGMFQHATGAQVQLRSAAHGFLSSSTAGTTASVGTSGNLLGFARVRSMIKESGVQGDPGAVYQLHLFDIQMNPGKNFRDVRSLHYNNGTYDGTADIITDVTAANTTIAKLYERANSSLVFDSGFESIQSVISANYAYRTIDETTVFANTGLLTKTLSAPGEEYPWAGTLSSAEMGDLYVVPVANSLSFTADLTGTVTLNTSSNVLAGAGTSFLSELEAGDWVRVYVNSTSFDVRRVTKVVTDTTARLDAVGADDFSGVNFKRTFPMFIPIPFGVRSGLSANVDVLGTTLTLNLGGALDFTGTVNTAVGVTIQRIDPEPVTKTAVRNRFVLLNLSNNEATHMGPWCLGVPDAFRLRNVYVHTAATVNTNSRNVTDAFYLDPNQNEDFYDLSFLYRRPNGNYRTKSTDFLLVEFDYMTRPDDGYFTYQSYTGTANVATLLAQDSLNLASLTTSLHSAEIPELPLKKRGRQDLVAAIDFRPAVANTSAPSASEGSAPTNPPYTIGFGNTADPANDKRFPVPASVWRGNIAFFETRFDSVYLYPSGTDVLPKVIVGNPAATKRGAIVPPIPLRAMRLYDIEIPAYPSFPENRSGQLNVIGRTGRIEDQRLIARQSQTLINEEAIEAYQPRRYTMRDLNEFDKRLRALEYYTTLALAETDVFKKTIPSSIDPSLNRFKYGFFVDNFESDNLQAEQHPEYAARIEAGQLMTPSVLRMPVGFRGGVLHPNYVDWEVIKQVYATKRTNEEPPEPPPPPPGDSRWEGVMKSRILDWSAEYSLAEGVITFTGIVGADCRGLKPDTQHHLYPLHSYEDSPPMTEQTETVKQYGKDWGDPLITDEEKGYFADIWNNPNKEGEDYQLTIELNLQIAIGLKGANGIFYLSKEALKKIAQAMKNVEYLVRSPARTGSGTTGILKDPRAISWARSIPLFHYHYATCNATYEYEKPIDQLTWNDWLKALASAGGNLVFA